jgi:hypothetical protein
MLKVQYDFVEKYNDISSNNCLKKKKNYIVAQCRSKKVDIPSRINSLNSVDSNIINQIAKYFY